MFTVSQIGIVRSSLKDIKECPLQEHEHAPTAAIEISEAYWDTVADIHAGDSIIIFTWLHLADRSVQKTKPRNDPNAPRTGVFSTRSPDRPNPIGIHFARVQSVTRGKITVSSLEVLDNTPVIDIKPQLKSAVD